VSAAGHGFQNQNKETIMAHEKELNALRELPVRKFIDQNGLSADELRSISKKAVNSPHDSKHSAW